MGIEADFGKRPFQSFTTLNRFRNSVAHAFTGTVTSRRVEKDVGKEKEEYLKSWWEKQCTLKTAKGLLDDTKLMIETIHDKGKLGKYPLAFVSFASHSKY